MHRMGSEMSALEYELRYREAMIKMEDSGLNDLEVQQLTPEQQFERDQYNAMQRKAMRAGVLTQEQVDAANARRT